MIRLRLRAALLGLAAVATAFPACAQQSQKDSKKVLAACIATMGGARRLRNVTTLSYDTIEHTFLHSLSVADSLPQIMTYERRHVVMQPRAYRLSEKHRWEWTESSVQVDSQLTISPEGGFTETNNKRTAIGGDLFYEAMDALASNPAAALLAALDSTDLMLRGQSADLYEIAFSNTIYGERVTTTIGIDKLTKRLQWIEIRHSYDRYFYGAMWGDTTKRFVYSAWLLDASGILLPTKWNVVTNGLLDGQISLDNVQVNPDVAAEAFSIPQDFTNSFDVLRRQSAADMVKLNIGEGEYRDIAEGVVMLPAKERAYNSLVVRQDDELVIIEAPWSNANSETVLTVAKRTFPGLPVTAVVSTNAIWLHIAGLPAYAKTNIPIYALNTNRGLIERLLASQVGENHIPLGQVQIQSVAARTEIGKGNNRIVLIPFRGPASARMLAVYLPGPKLLYCSDVYLPKPWGHQYWIEHLSEIRDLIDHEHLEVEQILGVSTPPHEWKDLAALIPPDVPTESKGN